jgi:hypothetical protein
MYEKGGAVMTCLLNDEKTTKKTGNDSNDKISYRKRLTSSFGGFNIGYTTVMKTIS